MNKLRTAVLVAFITLLVWVLAESQTLRVESASVTLIVAPGPASESRVVRVSPDQPWDGTVQLRLEGSAARVDDLLNQLRDPLTLRLGVELPTDAGEHVIPLRATLGGSEALVKSGVTVAETQPEALRIEVDERQTVRMPVRVEVPDGEVEGEPTPTPAQIAVVGPASVLGALSDGAEIVARVDAAMLARLVPGIRETVRVRVELPGALATAWGVVPEVTQVVVELTLQSKMKTLSLPSIPVQVRVAPSELARWDIEIPDEDQGLNNVKLTGPGTLIDQIAGGQIKPVAVVSLSYEELERGTEVKECEIVGLPAGVQYEVEDRAIHLTITRREPGAEGVPPASGE